MTDTKDNSSLPLLMSITGAVVVVAVGGWLFLEQESPQPERTYEPPPELASNAAESTRAEQLPDGDVVRDELDGPTIDIIAVANANNPPTSGVDVELRKAQLAADAELLIYPAEQSAFYYYGRVLAAEPYHAVASAELDTVLANVSLTVNQHMSAEEYAEAYAISQTVATLRPQHDLVVDTQRTLDQLTEDLVSNAIQNARDGNDAVANQLLADAAELPGRSTDYFAAVRESIAEIREVRLAAERDRKNRAQLAEDEAKAAWMNSVRAAISAGNLVAPVGASALDLLAENNRWETERAEMDAELLHAIMFAASMYTEAYDFETAELLLAAGENYPDEEAKFDELRAALEDAYSTYESNRVKNVSELVAVKFSPPRYPRIAEKRSTTGWVQILFTVAADGSTEQIEVTRSEPEDIFDRAAIQAVDNWKFEPVEYRGRLINQRVGTRLVFKIAE